MRIPSAVRFADQRLAKAYERLKSGVATERQLQRELETAFENISENAFIGTQIPKRLIPEEYRRRYGTHNLWKYDLRDGWRLLYSIESDTIVVVSIIIEWTDHSAYERRFKY